jgi:hypothetical protein
VGALEVWDDVGWEVHGKEGGIGNGQVEWLGWGYSPAAPKGISAIL